MHKRQAAADGGRDVEKVAKDIVDRHLASVGG